MDFSFFSTKNIYLGISNLQKNFSKELSMFVKIIKRALQKKLMIQINIKKENKHNNKKKKKKEETKKKSNKNLKII